MRERSGTCADDDADDADDDDADAAHDGEATSVMTQTTDTGGSPRSDVAYPLAPRCCMGAAEATTATTTTTTTATTTTTTTAMAPTSR